MLFKKSLACIVAVVVTCAVIAPSAVYADSNELTIVSPALWDNISPYSEGMALVKKGDKYGYIDEKGVAVIPPQFQVANSFHGGRAVVSTSVEEWNREHAWYKTIDKTGKTLEYLDYSTSSGFTSGYSEGVSLEGGGAYEKFTAMDVYRDVVYTLPKSVKGYGIAQDYSVYQIENSSWVFYGEVPEAKEGTLVYFDEKGHVLFKLDNANQGGTFNQGLAPVAVNGKFGFVNKEGDFVISPQYDGVLISDNNYSCKVFYEEIATVKKGDKFGAIDKAGNTAIEFKYQDMGCAKGGLVPVKINGKWSYVNTKGELVLDVKSDTFSYFNNGVALIDNGTGLKLMDNTGKFVSDKVYPFDEIYTVASDDYFYFVEDGKYGVAKY